MFLSMYSLWSTFNRTRHTSCKTHHIVYNKFLCSLTSVEVEEAALN
jgi:hypothetical protein